MTNQQTDPNLEDGFLRQHIKHQNTKMTENLQALMFVVNLWWLLVRMHSYTGWILMRYNFGERFLPTAIILSSSFSCYIAAQLSQSRVGAAMAVWLFIFACFHRFQIGRRNKRGDIWHSYDHGTSYFAHLVPEKYEKYILPTETGLAFVLGFVLFASGVYFPGESEHPIQFYVPSAFGIYIISVGTAMMLQAGKMKRDARNLLLDARDSQIDNQAFAAQQDRDMQDTEVDALLAGSGVAKTV